MLIKGNDIGKIYRDVMINLLTYGDESAPRGMKTVEILGAQIRLKDMRANILATPERDLNFRFMIAEWLWIEAGRDDVKFIEQYNRNITQFSDDGNIFNGAYGPRLAPQWDYVINSLHNPDTRQAVATIWTPSPSKSLDIPCTVAFQFLIRGGKLNLIATMRSSDSWLGLPYDMFNFSMIANGIAGKLGVEPGELIMQLGSLHLYEQNWDQAKVLINNSDSQTIWSPKLPDRPPAWDMTSWCQGTFVPWEQWTFESKINAPWREYIRALQVPTKKAAKEILCGLQ
jgi:thymidylate synthase